MIPLRRRTQTICLVASLLLLAGVAGSAEVIFTPAELATMQGPEGIPGVNGQDGTNGIDGQDGTRITELLGTCSADIGGLIFEWGCTVAGTVPPDPTPDPVPDPIPDPTPDPAPPTSIPDIPFNYLQAPGPVTASGELPAMLFAGEVLDFTGQTTPNDNTITCSGTEQNPAFILGGTLTGNNNVFSIRGSWCVFIGTTFVNQQPRTFGDHQILRNVEIRDLSGKNGTNLSGTDIVIVDSEIHHNQGNDRHGIFVASGSDRVWILRNEIHHNGGDGFQACNRCFDNPPQNVYIGDNLFYSDRENAIDFKYINTVIVEGNTMHSLVAAPPDVEWCFDDGSGCGVFSSGSDGSAMVIGSDGAPTGVQILNNEIYDTVNAIRIEESEGVIITGNNFHDLANRCLALDKWGLNTVFSNNRCANVGRGIFQNWRENFTLTVAGNVFENISGAAVEYESRAVWEGSTLTDNVFTATGPIIHNNQSYATEAEINGSPGASGNVVN